jgi:hypothetical protein
MRAGIALFVIASTVILRDTPAAAADLYVARRGWHLDVGFAADSLGSELAPILGSVPDARYVFFGLERRVRKLARPPALERRPLPEASATARPEI